MNFHAIQFREFAIIIIIIKIIIIIIYCYNLKFISILYNNLLHRHLGWVVHSGHIIHRWRRRWGRCRPEGAQIPVAGSHSHVHSFDIWKSRVYKFKGLCFSYSTWSTPLSLYWRHAGNFFLISTLVINYTSLYGYLLQRQLLFQQRWSRLLTTPNICF